MTCERSPDPDAPGDRPNNPLPADDTLTRLGQTAMLNHAGVGLAVLDLDLNHVEVNSVLATLNRKSADDIVSQHVRDVMPAAFSDEAEPHLRRILAGDRGAGDLRVTGRLDDDTDPPDERTWKISFAPIHRPDGPSIGGSEVGPGHGSPNDIVGVAMRIVDITDDLARTRALRESQLRLRSAIDGSGMGAWEWVPESDRLDFDARCHEMWGTSDPLCAAELFPMIDEADRPGVEKKLQRLIDDDVFYDAEFQITAGDGTRRWISGRASALRDEDGSLQRIVGVNWDITERRRREARRREEQWLRSLAMASAKLGAWDLDIEQELIHWDPTAREMFGFTESPTPMAEALSRVDPEDRPSLQASLDKAFASTGDHFFESRYRINVDGGPRHIHSVGRCIDDDPADGSGTRRRFLGVLRDATPEQETQRRLEAARAEAESSNAAKSQFLANMSHEIRTPMSAILGYTDILAQHVDDPDDQALVETIRRNGRFLLEIINDILDLAKIESGMLQVEHTPFAPESVVHEVVSLMEIRSREKHLDFKVDFEGLIPETITSDALRLRQVLINLVGNAIKFTESGSVRIRVFSAQQHIVFEITDTGIGIGAEELDGLFEPFSQADASLRRRHGGTGLGLTICRRLCAALGGELTVQSKLGAGSMFSARIPVGGAAAAAHEVDLERGRASGVAPPRPSADRLRGRRVLVVDDRREMRALVQFLLEEAGAEVTSAKHGREAIQMLYGDAFRDDLSTGKQPALREPYDAVVMDMQMPVMDGYTAATTLRSLGCKLPIVAVTAHAMQGEKQLCLDAGCDAYTTKPLDGDLLLDLITERLPPLPA